MTEWFLLIAALLFGTVSIAAVVDLVFVLYCRRSVAKQFERLRQEIDRRLE